MEKEQIIEFCVSRIKEAKDNEFKGNLTLLPLSAIQTKFNSIDDVVVQIKEQVDVDFNVVESTGVIALPQLIVEIL